jgi:hypothetical protein
VANLPANMQNHCRSVVFTAKPNAKAPARNNFSYIIMPLTKYLDRINPERGMTVQECCAALAEAAEFDAMLTNPALFEAIQPDMDADDHCAESSLPPSRPAGGEVGQVGTVEVYVSRLLRRLSFGHSTLMPLLYDSFLQFRSEWSTQQLSSNGKSTRSPSDWAELHEDEDQPSRSEQWADIGLRVSLVRRT